MVTRGSDGSIYFTDPDYGRWNDWIGQQRTQDGVGFRAVCRVPPGGGELQLVVPEDEFDQPNGLAFSPDESLLYVNDSRKLELKVFDVRADGTLGPGRVLSEGVGAGRAGRRQLRRHGVRRARQRLVTGPGGVWVVSPEGEKIGVVETPEVCGSLCWGAGDESHTLFL